MSLTSLKNSLKEITSDGIYLSIKLMNYILNENGFDSIAKLRPKELLS